MSKNILFILTSHGQLGDSDQPTGFHYEEMTTPYFAFKDAGFDVLIASIAGGQPPHDPSSLKENPEDNPASVQRFTNDPLLMNALKHSRSVYELPNEELEKFAAVYLPGGHGTMWDLPNCERLTEIIEQFYKAGKPVSAVCHGIAGLINAKDEHGESILKGKSVNCFTNAEECEIELDQIVPFLLESKVKDLGARFEKAGKFEAYVAVDDQLVTGQNPPSAEFVAKAVIRLLKS